MNIPAIVGRALAQRGAANAREVLKSKVIRAYDAYLCCKNSGLRHKLALLQFADHLEETFGQTIQAGATVDFPRMVEIEPVFQWARPVARPDQGVIIIPGTGSTIVDLPPNVLELRRLLGFLRAVGTEKKTEDGNCFDCVRKKLLGQGGARRRGLWTSGSTGETNRMRIRIPHS